jgi:tetratricopeptide (TPR) repeat protein
MEQTAKLQHAATLMQGGRLAEGEALCRQVLKVAPAQPEALHLLALAARDRGNVAEAEGLFRKSLAQSPRQPGVLVNFANFRRAQGRVAEARELLRRAIEWAPDFVPAWQSLGNLLLGIEKFSEARGCATRVTALAPRHAAGWELLAAIEQRQGQLDAAIAACRDGLKHSPAAKRLNYSLGQLLRQDCSFAEAALAYENARRCGYETPELYQNRGEALYEAGDVQPALECFAAGIARFPGSALLHGLWARFHWQLGGSGDSLATLRRAARSDPQSAALWQVLIDLLIRLDRAEEGRATLAEAQTLGCPQTPDLQLLDAICRARTGEQARATELFAGLVAAHPRQQGFKLAFAEHLLSAGDPARAEVLCAEVLEREPLKQSAWAFRGTAWQLLGDRRESWLLDYERMVRQVQVPPPAGYASSGAFLNEVRAVLETMHRMQAHPIEQTVRGGTQTNGFLFRLKHPLLRVLEQQIRLAVRETLASFPSDPGHPYWGRRPGRTEADGFRFAGAWSVRLRSQGYHTNHIHPEGWISSALYVALPEEVRNGEGDAGYLQFGVPPAELGLAVPPRRSVKPEVGVLSLFPSYMWHGTVPFSSEQPRITVAFDLVPNG